MIVTIYDGPMGEVASVRIFDKPGRALRAWAVALAIWIAVPVFKFAGRWQERAIGVVLAIAFGAVLELVIRSAWRRAIARPTGHSRIDHWLMTLPAWLSALLIICVYMAVPTAIVLGMGSHFHSIPFMSQWGLGGMFINACGWAGFWALVRREQRRRQALVQAADA